MLSLLGYLLRGVVYMYILVSTIGFTIMLFVGILILGINLHFLGLIWYLCLLSVFICIQVILNLLYLLILIQVILLIILLTIQLIFIMFVEFIML